MNSLIEQSNSECLCLRKKKHWMTSQQTYSFKEKLWLKARRNRVIYTKFAYIVSKNLLAFPEDYYSKLRFFKNFGQASLCLRVYDTTIYAGFSMMLHDKMDILDRLTRYCGLLVKMIKRRPKFYPQLVDAQDRKTWFEIQFLLNHIDHCIMMMQFYFQSHTKESSDIEFERHICLLSTFRF